MADFRVKTDVFEYCWKLLLQPDPRGNGIEKHVSSTSTTNANLNTGMPFTDEY